MKKVLALLALAVGGLLAYNFATTGELRLMPLLVMSEDERAVLDLEHELRRAAAELSQAGRSAGLGGIDTSSQAEAALARINRVRKDLEDLRKRVDSDASRQRIDQLLDEIARLEQRR